MVVTRILVVDDETALVELVRGHLEREQYEVLTAADGRTASPRELVARVKALLRRPRQTAAALSPGSGPPDDAPAPLRWDDLLIDEAQHEVTLHGQPVELTAREFALLLALARHPGRVFTRPQLLERVWGDAYYDEHVVDVHVGNLRKKLEADPAHPHYLETVRGVGYRFRRKRE